VVCKPEGGGDSTGARGCWDAREAAAASFDEIVAGDGFGGADKHGGAFAFVAGDEFEEGVDAVAEVDIGVTWGAPHGCVARGFAAEAVVGGVVLRTVGLNLGDPQRDVPRLDCRAEKCDRDVEGVAAVELGRKDHGCLMLCGSGFGVVN